MSILKQKVKGAAKPISVVTKPQLNVASVQTGLNPEFNLTETSTGYDVDVKYPIGALAFAPEIEARETLTGTVSKIGSYPMAYAVAPDDGWVSARIDCSTEGLLILFTSPTLPTTADTTLPRANRDRGTSAQRIIPVRKGDYVVFMNNSASATISSSQFVFFPVAKSTTPSKVAASDTTFYVRANGNDNNDGLTAAKAVKTLAGLLTQTRKYNFNNFTVTVDIGAGEFAVPFSSYTTFKYSDFVGAQTVVFQGASKTTTTINGGIFGFFFIPYVTVKNLTVSGNRLCFSYCFGGTCTDVDHVANSSLTAIIFYKTLTSTVNGTHKFSGKFASLVSSNGSSSVSVSAAMDVSELTSVTRIMHSINGSNLTVTSSASFTGTIASGKKFEILRGSTFVCPVALPAPDAGIIDASSTFSNAEAMPTDLPQERIVGMLNGAPLYERMVMGTTPSSASGQLFSTADWNIKMVHYDQVIIHRKNNGIDISNFYKTSSDYHFTYWNRPQNCFWFEGTANAQGGTFTATVRYTKTTD